MTRKEAVAILIQTNSRLIERLRLDLPEWKCDILQQEAAEDEVDILIALGILKLDPDDAIKA